MKIDVITLFPEMFIQFITTSIIGRAIKHNLVEINVHNLRDYSTDAHHKVDDTPYGGGDGMVLTCQPVFDCIEKLRTKDSCVIMLTPDGTTFDEANAYDLSRKKHLIVLCGHYEGFDERIRSIVDMEISIGDYILTGGEIPSMVIMDSVIRLIPGVIKENSHLLESFNNNLLDYPVYTKPSDFRGLKVPDVLLSGDHKKIAEYRLVESKKKTAKRRPDLLKK